MKSKSSYLAYRAALVVAIATLCAQAHAQSNNPFSALGKVIGEGVTAIRGAASQAAGAVSPTGAAPALPAAPTQPVQPVATQGVTGAGGAGGVTTTERALFAKHVVNGDDLYETLKRTQVDLRNQRDAQAWTRAAGALNQGLPALANGNMDVGTIFSEVLLRAAMESMKTMTVNVATKTLDEYMDYLLGQRRDLLSAQTVELPAPAGMSPNEMHRTVTMAALIVAARVSNQVLDQADKDFKSMQVDYKQLISQRQEAAKLLFAVVDQRRQAQRSSDAASQAAAESDIKRSLSDRDLSFMDAQFNSMSVKDFAEDMGAQNLAIQYLRSKDPAAFKDYRTRADDVVRRTQAYVRTVSGVGAMGALMIAFGHSVAEVAGEQNLSAAMRAMPLGVEFVKASAPLVPRSVEVSLHGVDLATQGSTIATWIKGRPDAFTVVQADKTSNVRAASDVFKSIQENNLSDAFVGALFLNEGVGWLNRVQICDPEEAGRMMDASVPQAARTKFATDYYAWTDQRATDYNFVQGLGNPGSSAAEKRLPNLLFGADQRHRAQSLPVAEVQRVVESNYTAWGDAQLMRLIFDNRDTSAAYARLDVGAFSVRPIPSPASVYAYESRVEACRRTSDADMGHASQPTKPGSRPQSPAH